MCKLFKGVFPILVIISLAFLSQLVHATTREAFPRKTIECGTYKEIENTMSHFGEEVLVHGSTLNGKKGSFMLFTINQNTKTYTIFVMYPDLKKGCLVDSGQLVLRDEPVEQKPNERIF